MMFGSAMHSPTLQVWIVPTRWNYKFRTVTKPCMRIPTARWHNMPPARVSSLWKR